MTHSMFAQLTHFSIGDVFVWLFIFFCICLADLWYICRAEFLPLTVCRYMIAKNEEDHTNQLFVAFLVCLAAGPESHKK